MRDDVLFGQSRALLNKITTGKRVTANGLGHWFDADGNVTEWDDNAHVFSEFNESDFIFSVGQYPGANSPEDSYTIKQALVYEYEPGNMAQVTFEIKITVE